jgi:hypothetical protein
MKTRVLLDSPPSPPPPHSLVTPFGSITTYQGELANLVDSVGVVGPRFSLG